MLSVRKDWQNWLPSVTCLSMHFKTKQNKNVLHNKLQAEKMLASASGKSTGALITSGLYQLCCLWVWMTPECVALQPAVMLLNGTSLSSQLIR